MYNNQTPYVDHNGGLDLGASLDYYFKFIGVGADFDHIHNSPKNKFSTNNLFQADGTTPLTNLTLNEEQITRMFWGIGSNFRYQNKSKKIVAELNTRVGLSNIKHLVKCPAKMGH